MTKIIDGKAISAQIKEEVKQEIAKLKEAGREVTLAVIQVGDDPASSVYVGNKKKACAYVGIVPCPMSWRRKPHRMNCLL